MSEKFLQFICLLLLACIIVIGLSAFEDVFGDEFTDTVGTASSTDGDGDENRLFHCTEILIPDHGSDNDSVDITIVQFHGEFFVDWENAWKAAMYGDEFLSSIDSLFPMGTKACISESGECVTGSQWRSLVGFSAPAQRVAVNDYYWPCFTFDTDIGDDTMDDDFDLHNVGATGGLSSESPSRAPPYSTPFPASFDISGADTDSLWCMRLIYTYDSTVAAEGSGGRRNKIIKMSAHVHASGSVCDCEGGMKPTIVAVRYEDIN